MRKEYVGSRDVFKKSAMLENKYWNRELNLKCKLKC